MTPSEALALVHQALAKALARDVTVTLETDLFGEEILDSLDTMIFFLTLEEISGVKFPSKELAEAGFNRVVRIVEHLVNPPPAQD